jgi:hypothetical protein
MDIQFVPDPGQGAGNELGSVTLSDDLWKALAAAKKANNVAAPAGELKDYIGKKVQLKFKANATQRSGTVQFTKIADLLDFVPME